MELKMHDDWLIRIGGKILEIMPAIGGAFISLRNLPKEQRTLFGVLSAFVGGILIAVFGGEWIIGYYALPNYASNFVMLALGIGSILLLDILVRAIKDIKISDVKSWIKEGLKKWLT